MLIDRLNRRNLRSTKRKPKRTGSASQFQLFLHQIQATRPGDVLQFKSIQNRTIFSSDILLLYYIADHGRVSSPPNMLIVVVVVVVVEDLIPRLWSYKIRTSYE